MSTGKWVSTSMPYLAPPDKQPPDAWAAEAAARGTTGRQRIVSAGEVTAPPEVAELLKEPVGAAVVVRRRVMYSDDQACELTDTYYPLAVAAGTGLARTAKIPGGAVSLLAELGHVGVHAQEDVSAALPDAEAREVLQLARDEPVLKIIRVITDTEEHPFQVDVITMPARLQRLRYEIRIR